jgi:allantoin racemase
VKIWYQVISSADRLPQFIAALDRLCRRVAGTGTEVAIRGTSTGGSGDDYAAVRQIHAVEIVTASADAVAREGYDCYVLANSLDPGLDALRERLEIPVLSLMQIGSSLATMIGDRFGIIAPNERFGRLYERLVAGYGLSARLAGTAAMPFTEISVLDRVFSDETTAARTIDLLSGGAETLGARGAEVLIVPSPLSCLLGDRGVFELGGLPVIEVYGAAVAMAEAVVSMRAHSGFRTSRAGRFAQPAEDTVRTALDGLGKAIAGTGT